MRTLNPRNLILMALLLIGLSWNATGCLVIVDGEGGHDGKSRCHSGHDDDDDDGDESRCHDSDEWGWGEDRPSRPTRPTDPTDPTDPTGPTDPTDPNCPVSAEVCGEDGVTYASPCDASRAHVRVAHMGACGQACFFDEECSIGELCNTNGRCEQVVCPAVYEPVCGADGQTYGNACEASVHHVAVDYAGECAPPCSVDADCASGDLCEANRCVTVECPVLAPNDISQEVCAEDGFTYQTSCHARQARQSVVHEGCCI